MQTEKHIITPTQETHTAFAIPYNIFLADDNHDDLHHMMAILRSSPYIGLVTCFCSGDDMKKHFVIEGYYSGSQKLCGNTLILLSLHLPEMISMTLLRELKAHPHTAKIPVLLTARDVSHEQKTHAESLKADGIIRKPLDINHIHDVLRQRGHNIPECRAAPLV